MSQENVEVVREAVAALNERDLDRYLACCAEDIQLLLPTAPIEGTYEGVAGVRRFLADLQDALPDFRLEVERLQAIGADQVLGFLRASASARTTGIDIEVPVTNVYDLAHGKIKRVQAFRDREAALQAAGLSE